MHEPLKRWHCDVCGDYVTARDGYVVWDRFDQPDFAYRIIHQNRCDDQSCPSSLPLADFLGHNGVVRLTSKLSLGPLMRYEPPSVPFGQLPPLGAFVDFFRRVQVPHYEEARRYFATDEAYEELITWNEVAPYMQTDIEFFAEKALEPNEDAE